MKNTLIALLVVACVVPQTVLAEIAQDPKPSQNHGFTDFKSTPAAPTPNRAAKSDPEKKALLKEVVELQTQQLAAGEKELLDLQEKLRAAKNSKTTNKVYGITITVVGVAVLLGLSKVIRQVPGGRADLLDKIVVGAIGGAGGALVADGVYKIAVAGKDIPQWEQAVDEKMKLIQVAKEKNNKAKARLEELN
jgi:hypothetical protein